MLAALTGIRHIAGSFPEHLLRFLHRECSRLHREIGVPRPWHYGELHNPWARAASAYDSWGFLELCHAATLRGLIAERIGGDIILFDSQWLPEPSRLPSGACALESDAHRFPVDPLSGVTVLVAFTDTATIALGDASLALQRGDVVLLDARTRYCLHADGSSAGPAVYAIRYFPASSLYDRDPTAPVQRALTERYPLFNYARMPLWLVQGRDQVGNDFVTGFDVRAGFWTNAAW